LTIVLAAGLAWAAQPWLRKAYVYHVLDDWIFHWQDTLGRRPDFDARLDRFGRHLAAAARDSSVEEILVVGHSTGAIVAIECVARALARDPKLGRHGPGLALLTIGARVPISALWSSARRLREAIARVATEPSLLWVEYQAPQDPFHAFRFDPVRDLQLDLGARARANPVIRSARFKQTLLPHTYRRLRLQFFRLHFQFLMANERPGECDYLMIACGPVSLADRIRDPQQAVIDAYGAGVEHGVEAGASDIVRADHSA
jgi:pimeloyl-ACP methyl ester carboxylesterase